VGLGLDPNLPTKAGITPLMLAIQNKDLVTAQWLVQTAKVKLEVVDEDGGNALHHAARNAGLEAVQWLVGLGLDPNLPTKAGITPLMLAIQNKDLVTAQWLVQTAKVKLDVLNQNGDNALHHAARYAGLEAVQWLVELGLDPNLPIKDGRTPLMLALANKDLATAQWLVQTAKVELDVRSENGLNALHQAARFAGLEAVQWLVEAGLDPNQPIKNGRTPLMLALHNKDLVTAQWLVQTAKVKLGGFYAGGETVLHKAIEAGRLSLVKAMLASGTLYPNAPTKNGITPLALAIQHKHTVIAQYLIEEQHVAPIQDGWTAMHEAANVGDLVLIQWLWEHKLVDPNMLNKQGFTPLMRASIWGHTEAVKWLIDVAEVDVHVVNKKGCSALDYAKSLNRTAVITLLESAGAKPSASTDAAAGEADTKGSEDTLKPTSTKLSTEALRRASMWAKRFSRTRGGASLSAGAGKAVGHTPT
jgi:ankyrin repeat protein